MTDDEIIRALEYCTDGRDCDGCPYRTTASCSHRLRLDVVNLINRQKAEVERLKIDDECLVTQIKDAYEQIQRLSAEKSEAIKEFAERLKKKTDNPGKAMFDVYEYYGETIDNLVKEMTESKK